MHTYMRTYVHAVLHTSVPFWGAPIPHFFVTGPSAQGVTLRLLAWVEYKDSVIKSEVKDETKVKEEIKDEINEEEVKKEGVQQADIPEEVKEEVKDECKEEVKEECNNEDFGCADLKYTDELKVESAIPHQTDVVEEEKGEVP